MKTRRGPFEVSSAIWMAAVLVVMLPAVSSMHWPLEGVGSGEPARAVDHAAGLPRPASWRVSSGTPFLGGLEDIESTRPISHGVFDVWSAPDAKISSDETYEEPWEMARQGTWHRFSDLARAP